MLCCFSCILYLFQHELFEFFTKSAFQFCKHLCDFVQRKLCSKNGTFEINSVQEIVFTCVLFEKIEHVHRVGIVFNSEHFASILSVRCTAIADGLLETTALHSKNDVCFGFGIMHQNNNFVQVFLSIEKNDVIDIWFDK